MSCKNTTKFIKFIQFAKRIIPVVFLKMKLRHFYVRQRSGGIRFPAYTPHRIRNTSIFLPRWARLQ